MRRSQSIGPPTARLGGVRVAVLLVQVGGLGVICYADGGNLSICLVFVKH
jgi:hypothetical protein